MNHDICHCEGINCTLRDMCVRYIAHTKIQEAKGIHLQYAKPRHEGNYCELFWRYHEKG